MYCEVSSVYATIISSYLGKCNTPPHVTYFHFKYVLKLFKNYGQPLFLFFLLHFFLSNFFPSSFLYLFAFFIAFLQTMLLYQSQLSILDPILWLLEPRLNELRTTLRTAWHLVTCRIPTLKTLSSPIGWFMYWNPSDFTL
jgi:hypothetical protein